MSKRENPKTAVDTKAKKTEILSAKTEKAMSKVTKTAKPKNPTLIYRTPRTCNPNAMQTHYFTVIRKTLTNVVYHFFHT